MAAKSGNVHAARALAKCGCELDRADLDGRTPVWWAVHANAVPVLELLAGAGAHVDLPDATGVTPLGHAVACRWQSVAVEGTQGEQGEAFKMAHGTSKRAAALFLL